MARQPSLKQQFLASPEAQAAARLYLQQRGYHVAKLGPAQLYRYTTKVAKAETAGAGLPTLGELRGHKAEGVQHILLDRKGAKREHYFIRRSDKVEKIAEALREGGFYDALTLYQFTHRELKNLFRAVQKADKASGHVRRSWPIIVRGWAKRYPGWAPDPESNPLHFLKGALVTVDNETIVEYLAQKLPPDASSLNFLNELYGEQQVEWVDVQQVAIPMSYDEPKGK